MFDIAVIIPTHNRATLLPAALDSVLAQTTEATLEVAVVDDGSTDHTPEVMKPYLEKYSGGKVVMRYTRQEKQGVVAARNRAIQSTSAPVIAFLDSDDFWDPRKLEMQIRALETSGKPSGETSGGGYGAKALGLGANRVGLCHTSFRYVNEQGEMTDDGPQRVNNPCVGKCVDVLMNEFLVLFSSVMVRRSVVEEIASTEPHGQPFDPRWTNAQDYDFVLRASRVTALAYVSEPVTLYRLHGAHGAMGNLKKAFGFHCRVQMDFARRWGKEIGISEAEAKKRAGAFLFGRAESAFWRRELKTCGDLCALAKELEISHAKFVELEGKANRPAWIYKVKDRLDKWR